VFRNILTVLWTKIAETQYSRQSLTIGSLSWCKRTVYRPRSRLLEMRIALPGRVSQKSAYPGDYSKISHTLAITEIENRQKLPISRKSTIPWRLLMVINRPRLWARGVPRRRFLTQSSLLANVINTRLKITQTLKTKHCTGRSLRTKPVVPFLSPVRNATYIILVKTPRKRLGSA
jgi:hypothetical protein